MPINIAKLWAELALISYFAPPLEKVAGGTPGHLSENFLRKFLVKYPIPLPEDEGRSIEDGELRMGNGGLRIVN